ncbi:MAG: phytanoyl-CoA dioxygenase family protein [Actinopolymorphaceae bacterium]
MAPVNDSTTPGDVRPPPDAAGSVLSAEEVTRFHEQGFLALRSFISPDEVTRMRAIYDGLFSSRAGRAEGNQFDLAGPDEDDGEARLPQILKPSQYAPEILQSQTIERVEAVLLELLGPTAQRGGDHAINKPPRQGAETPWHQDEAYWDPALRYNSVSIWIPLQEATVDNGCMHFIAGSHKGDVIPHRPIGGDPRVHGLEAVPGNVDVSAAVACPLPPGGATIHHSRTVHYASANRSADHRRAYIIGGGTPRTPNPSPQVFPWREAQQTTTARARRARDATP